jgi:NAD(P)H-flavin reductase
VELLACADDERDLYFDDLLPATAAFHFERIADARRDQSNRGLAWLTANAHRWDAATRVILSGSPAFVYAATDVLVAQGTPEESLESDVYAWAPR